MSSTAPSSNRSREDALAQRAALLASALSTMGEAVILLEDSGATGLANAPAARLLGVPEGEVTAHALQAGMERRRLALPAQRRDPRTR